MVFPGKKKKKESRFKSCWLRFLSVLHSAPWLGNACISLHAKPHLGSILFQWRFPLQSTMIWFYSLALRGPSYSRLLGCSSVADKYWQQIFCTLFILETTPRSYVAQINKDFSLIDLGGHWYNFSKPFKVKMISISLWGWRLEAFSHGLY